MAGARTYLLGEFADTTAACLAYPWTQAQGITVIAAVGISIGWTVSG